MREDFTIKHVAGSLTGKIYFHPHLLKHNLCVTQPAEPPRQTEIHAPEPFTQASIRPLSDRGGLLYCANSSWEVTFKKYDLEIKFHIDPNSARDPRNIFLGNPKAADILPQGIFGHKECWIEHVPETKMCVMSWNDLPPETTMQELLDCVIKPYFQTVLSHIENKFSPQDAETLHMFKMTEMRIEHVPESSSDEIKRWIESCVIKITQQVEDFIFRHKLEGVVKEIIQSRNAQRRYDYDSILSQLGQIKNQCQPSKAEDFLHLTQEHHTGPKPNCISLYSYGMNEFYFYIHGVSFDDDDVMGAILNQVGRKSLLDALIMKDNGPILNLDEYDSIEINTVPSLESQTPRRLVSEKYVVSACFTDLAARRAAITHDVYDFIQALPGLMKKMQDAVNDITRERVDDEIWAPLRDLPDTLTRSYKRSADFCGISLDLWVTVRLRKL